MKRLCDALPLESQVESVKRDKSFELFRDWCFAAKPKTPQTRGASRLVGANQIMLELRHQIQQYAPTDEPVLISGETGTGKELVAELLHGLSPRRKAPFVAINCAAIPGPLAESEFFGSTRGAYTSAVQSREGLFAQASGGTLFLDELGELPIEVQSKLLRALELGVYRRVGANHEERADVRILAATNRNLAEMMHRGQFRADLYYRINVLNVHTPALRDHRSDIPQLVGEILGGLLLGGGSIRVTAAAMLELMNAPWPGNVRELRNSLRRALVLCEAGVIGKREVKSLALNTRSSDDQERDDCASELITSLRRSAGRLGPVADELDVSIRTVQRRMKECGLRLKDFRTLS